MLLVIRLLAFICARVLQFRSSDHPITRSPDLFTSSESSFPLCFKGVGFSALIAPVPLTGCRKSQPPSESSSAAPRPATITVDASTAGSIAGTVSFKGAAPKLKPLDMTQDPGCPSQPQPADAVVVNVGKLANVFVYVKEGLPPGTFAVSSETVVLDQKGCRYIPHMLGIMAG